MPPLVEASALLLVPRPQRLRQADGSAPADLPVEERTVGGLRPEGFRLAIRPDGITLEHRDDRGRRDGRATLDQIRRQSGDHLSCLTIEDWPDLPTRGFVLDISRDRVPTRATLARHARRPRLAGGELTGAHGIELVPNQNCFGHMERWLRHDTYPGAGGDTRLRAHGRGAAGAGGPRPDAHNAAFALSLFDELLPNFASRQ